MNIELFRLAQSWANRTEEILREEMTKLDVIDTEELKKGLQSKVLQLRDKTIIELKFKKYGRFVDMGAGIKSKKQTRERVAAELLGTGKKRNQSTGKKWYSPVWFGRLSDLYGIIGFQIVEKVIATKNTE